jgi:putative transposase
MGQKRKNHSKEFKAKVALEAVKDLHTLSELAARYKVHPTQIGVWKKQLLEQAPRLFERGHSDGGTHADLSIACQCALLQIARSSAYYTPNTSESPEKLALMRRIDEQYLKTPFYGSPRMTWWLNEQGVIRGTPYLILAGCVDS